MPTYDYACTDCDHQFEVRQSFTDDALTQCPECSGRLRKLFNAVGVVFKGSGFYRTDSRSGGKGGPGSSSSSGGSSSNGSSSSSSSGSSSNSSSASDSSGSSSTGSSSSNGSGSGSSNSGSSGSTSSAPAAKAS